MDELIQTHNVTVCFPVAADLTIGMNLITNATYETFQYEDGKLCATVKSNYTIDANSRKVFNVEIVAAVCLDCKLEYFLHREHVRVFMAEVTFALTQAHWRKDGQNRTWLHYSSFDILQQKSGHLVERKGSCVDYERHVNDLKVKSQLGCRKAVFRKEP